MVQTDELLTAREAAAVLKVSPYTIYRWVAAGRLPAIRRGRRVLRLRRSDLEAAEHAASLNPASIQQTMEDMVAFQSEWRQARERAEGHPRSPGHGTVAALGPHFGALKAPLADELVSIIRQAREEDMALALAESRRARVLFEPH